MARFGLLAAQATGACLLICGCAPGNLYIAHDTVVGVNASVNAQRTSGRVIIGYDRNFGTYVPKSVEHPEGGREAMSVLSCSELEVKDIWLSKFTEYLGTGEAAIKYAERFGNGELQEAFKCIKQ